MKKTIRNTILIIVLILILISSVGCTSYSGEPEYEPPLHYQIKTDKIKYNHGDEITIEFFFDDSIYTYSTFAHTYCVKIKESPYYEIIGDSEVYTERSQDGEKIKGEYADYWYKATFKIRVAEEYRGTYVPEIVVKCIDDSWLSKHMHDREIHYSGDPEFPFRVPEEVFSFSATESGIEFTPLYSTTPAPKPFFNRMIDFILDIFYYIFSLFGYRRYY